eukprot:gene1423-2730_t
MLLFEILTTIATFHEWANINTVKHKAIGQDYGLKLLQFAFRSKKINDVKLISDLKEMEESTPPSQAEDVVSKYKRLLAMARSSLEANQATLAEKDKQISFLKNALEVEKSHNNSLQRKNHLGLGKFDDEQAPTALLRRIDIKDVIWILLEYESGNNDAWICFRSEQELDDFVQRGTGEPLVKPPKCLSPHESEQLELECKKRVDRIVEEFRRYKVRSEIARKQKDAEPKQSSMRTLSSLSSGISDDSVFMNDSRDPSSSLTTRDEVQKLQQQLVDNENKWKTSYEQLARENELMRNQNDNHLIMNRLRERYETCKAERDDLVDKLKIYTCMNTPIGLGKKSIEQSYIDLKAEYKEFRRRALALERDRQQNIEGLKEEISKLENETDNLHTSNTNNTNTQHVESTKLLHLRHLVLQYLCCREPEVKEHMENALITLLRFSNQEKLSIIERKKEENGGMDPTLFSYVTTAINVHEGRWAMLSWKLIAETN